MRREGEKLPSPQPTMRDNFDFHEPLNEEPDGTYITCGQMQFYLNREHGQKSFSSCDEEFMEYYNLCRVYNTISDIMKTDPDAAIMYWDDRKEIVSMGFPTNGAVAKALAKTKTSAMYESDEDEDEYGLMDGAPWNDSD